MATFPSIKPIYGQQKRSAPLTRTVRFADGYEHRILFGLAQHQNPKVFQLTFNVSETESDEIETFLDARANDSDSLLLPHQEKVHLLNLFVKTGVNQYHITIELQFKQLLEKYLNQHNVSKFSSI